MRASLCAALAVLLLSTALPAKPPPEPIRDGHRTIGPCKKSSDCVIAVPSGCCTNCSGEPVAVLKGTRVDEACGCALQDQFDAPACPKVSPASDFRAVCKRQRCLRAPAGHKK